MQKNMVCRQTDTMFSEENQTLSGNNGSKSSDSPININIQHFGAEVQKCKSKTEITKTNRALLLLHRHGATKHLQKKTRWIDLALTAICVASMMYNFACASSKTSFLDLAWWFLVLSLVWWLHQNPGGQQVAFLVAKSRRILGGSLPSSSETLQEQLMTQTPLGFM